MDRTEFLSRKRSRETREKEEREWFRYVLNDISKAAPGRFKHFLCNTWKQRCNYDDDRKLISDVKLVYTQRWSNSVQVELYNNTHTFIASHNGTLCMFYPDGKRTIPYPVQDRSLWPWPQQADLTTEPPSLSLDVALLISRYLSTLQLGRNRRVCKNWNAIFGNPVIWRERYRYVHRALGLPACNITLDNVDWASRYRNEFCKPFFLGQERNTRFTKKLLRAKPELLKMLVEAHLEITGRLHMFTMSVKTRPSNATTAPIYVLVNGFRRPAIWIVELIDTKDNSSIVIYQTSNCGDTVNVLYSNRRNRRITLSLLFVPLIRIVIGKPISRYTRPQLIGL